MMESLATVSTLAATVLLALAGGAVIVDASLRGRDKRIRQQVERITSGHRREGKTPFAQRIFMALGRRLLWRRQDFRELSRLTHAAGFFSVAAPYVFVAAQACVAVVLAAAGSFAETAFGIAPRSEIVTVFAAGTVGYALPRFVLRFLAARRLRAVRREIPFFIDMLLLLLRSGAGVERCFREIERFGVEAVPETHRTIRLLISDLDQGRNYDAALNRWADRMSDPAAGEIARQLQQAIRHGTELSRTLSQFAQRLIEQRLAEAREKAGRRSIHMTVATLVFLMPPLLIVLAAPGFSNLMHFLTGK